MQSVRDDLGLMASHPECLLPHSGDHLYIAEIGNYPAWSLPCMQVTLFTLFE